MSLEQAILDRLEKRNAQIAQLQSTVHALERAADSQREHAMREHKQLLEENKKLTEQITSARLEREQMQHQIAELRTERDRILEASRSLVPKSALKQAVQEAAELHAEVVKLRAEVPLESTREGLKNAVAKLQEVKTDRDRVLNELAAILAEANKSGRCGGDPVALIKQGQTDLDALTHFERDNARLDALVSKLQGELDKQKTQADSMERQVGGLTRTRLRLEFERDKMKAKLEPLEALYEVVKKHVDHGAIIDNRADIYDAVAETAKALSQLTA